jgi:GT2 family glycosyltransferase
MALVDVVVVSYNSRAHLRACIEPLANLEDVNVIVVDNASIDRSVEAVADLPVTAIPLEENRGFAYGCNVGWRAGEAPYVLFLNPDGRLDREALGRLLGVLEDHPAAGAAGPRIIGVDGSLAYSLRRFPRLRSTFAQALFLHRLAPRASWADELVRDERMYSRPLSPDWISGACILVRRTALERLAGWDERFFLYCEDADLCLRLRKEGFDIRYEPTAACLHEGGASGPRGTLLPVLAASRIAYARKHWGAAAVMLERVGVGLAALTHLLVGRGGSQTRAGHLRALKAAFARAAVAGHPARLT